MLATEKFLTRSTPISKSTQFSKIGQQIKYLQENLKPDDSWLTDAELSKLERSGDKWIKYFYPKRFSRPFTGYQTKYWDFTVHVADTREVNPDALLQPRVECEPRGVGKSTNLRGSIVYLLARKVKHYVLYVSATKDQAKKHFNAIKKLLENETLLKHYPHLRPKVSKHRNALTNWSSERLVTEAGQVIEFVSILGNARGFNTEEGLRLDLIAIDDIDDQKDSVDVTEKKLDILGANILGAGDETTDIIFAQNLIHRTSICTRLRDNTAGILLNRHFVGPFPLCKHYEFKEQPVAGDTTGAKEYKVIDNIEGDFQPYDAATSKEYVEILLNRLGPKRFERECQQNMNLVDENKDFREYSEIHHVITYSEFVKTFSNYNVPVWNKQRKSVQIPSQWNVALGQDFGTTPEHPTGIFPVARPNVNVPLNDSFFCFGEVVLPEYPRDTNKQAPLVSPRRVMVAEKEHLKKWNVSDHQIVLRRMSHEQSAAKNAYSEDLEEELKTHYSKWKAAKGSGIPQWQNILEIDYTQNHPFRVYPDNHPIIEKRGKPIQGRPKFYIIVPDDQGRLSCDETGFLYVAQPYNSDGAARLRAEIPVYSHRNTGKSKIFDDMVDGGRGVIGEFVLMPQSLTHQEKYMKHLQNNAPDLTPESIAKMDEKKQFRALAAEQIERVEFEKEQNRKKYDNNEYNDYLNKLREETEGIESGGFHEL